jgi:hypothetical protein
MSPPRITTVEPEYITGYWNDLFLGIWRGAPTVAGAREWSRQLEHMLARNPKGFACMSIVEATAPIPDGVARRALVATMDGGVGIRAIAGIQLAEGFTGAAVRCVLLAIANMTRSPYPRGIFKQCDEGARWLSPYLDDGRGQVTPARIIAVVNEFRSMCDPARTPAKVGMPALE